MVYFNHLAIAKLTPIPLSRGLVSIALLFSNYHKTCHGPNFDAVVFYPTLAIAKIDPGPWLKGLGIDCLKINAGQAFFEFVGPGVGSQRRSLGS